MENATKDKPLVSIWCLTYNHAPYIRDAIEGFLMQKTTFPFEIVIHDDASTDGTTEILREYEEKYPNLFHILYEKENTYNRKDRSQMYYEIKERELKGKYIALCEGDDYWTNPNKLQMQVDYMEAHDDCMMTTHNAQKIHFEENRVKLMQPFEKTERLTDEQVIRQSYGMTPTASYVVRKEAFLVKGFYLECPVGDWPLQLNCISMGYIYHFADVMSVYRYLHEGSWTSGVRGVSSKYISHCLRMILFLLKYNEFTSEKNKRWIFHRIHCYIGHIFCEAREMTDDEFEECINAFIKEFGNQNRDVVLKVSTIAKNIKTRNFYTQEFQQFHDSKKPVIIWGAGVYAEECTKQFRELGINILGYVVSKREEEKEMFFDKPIWESAELTNIGREFEIVVAVRVNLWNEILSEIEKNQLKNYIYPFRFSI